MKRDATRPLREGFTTGTAAAAAAKAATLALFGASRPEYVEVPLPAGGRMAVEIRSCAVRAPENTARAGVVKDAGDDPDATHGALIECEVRRDPSLNLGEILLTGGRGVGTVTRPGLAVGVGEPAINPAPRGQIRAAVAEALEEADISGEPPGLRVTVEVPEGERLAEKTLNAKLGILGGISILGTRGTVVPYSAEAWQATITATLDVARAAGLTTVGMTTGGRSERFLRARFPELPPEAVVPAADFFGFAMRAAAERDVGQVVWGVFFGKLVKQAMGLENTHARRAEMDLERLSRLCGESGVIPTRCRAVAGANTALHALEILREDPALSAVLARLTRDAVRHARAFAGERISVRHCLFSFDGTLLATAESP